MAATYETRPNRPTGHEYCPSLPTFPEPTELGVETVAALLARYNKNRRDWEGRNLPARQWQTVSLAVSAPGAGRGDLYAPPGNWVGPSAERATLIADINNLYRQGGVSVWTSLQSPVGRVLFRRLAFPFVAAGGALGGQPPPPNNDSDTSDDSEVDEAEELGNTTGM